HITGGGLANIPRMNEALDYLVHKLPSEKERPAIFNILAERSGLGMKDLYETFNMGVGLVIATADAQGLIKALHSHGEESAFVMGEIKAGSGKLMVSAGEVQFEL